MWKRKPCGCVKADLPRSGRILIRCEQHRGRWTWRRTRCHFEDGIVRRA